MLNYNKKLHSQYLAVKFFVIHINYKPLLYCLQKSKTTPVKNYCKLHSKI